jgi:hypothetical protein
LSRRIDSVRESNIALDGLRCQHKNHHNTQDSKQFAIHFDWLLREQFAFILTACWRGLPLSGMQLTDELIVAHIIIFES